MMKHLWLYMNREETLVERKELSNEEISRLIEAKSPKYTRLNVREKVYARIKELGANGYNLALPETHCLPYLLHEQEVIGGIVYGRYRQHNNQIIGRGAVVATDARIFLIDKKPLYLKYDELAYGSITGIAYTKVAIAGTLVIHTRLGDIKIRTFNSKCAKSFVRAVESIIYPDGEESKKNNHRAFSSEAP